MKYTHKLLGVLGSAVAYLTITGQAFAGSGSLNPCQDEANNPDLINELCKLDADQTGQIIATAVTVLLIASVIIALIFLIYNGIRWVTSGGDKGKVDEARKGLIAAIIGLIIAFLAYFILSLILNFFNIDMTNFELPKLIQ